VKKFDQKACVPITKRHEFIGHILEDEQARVVHVGIMIHSAAQVWISNSLLNSNFYKRASRKSRALSAVIMREAIFKNSENF
jgi:hypothetical protein